MLLVILAIFQIFQIFYNMKRVKMFINADKI